MDLRATLKACPVVPVLTIRQAEQAPALARALADGGLRVIEVTLRTPAALDAIERIALEVPETVVAAGTVRRPADLAAAASRGARFAFSPGLSDFMLEPGPIPMVPGVFTPSEVMRAAEAGLAELKFFPAVSGGPAVIKALHGPFPDVAFCPTGGVTAQNAGEFLGLANVLCVGGSWAAPPDAVEAGDWARITALARANANMRAK